MRGRFVVREVPVFILAGGRGERLAGVTDLPKPLLEIGGRPFLGYLFDGLARAGFHRVHLLTGHRAEIFPERLAREIVRHPELGVEFLREEQPLGTGGALARTLPRVERLAVVLNGDSFCALDWHAFLRFHAAQPDTLALAAVSVADARDYGALVLGEHDRLIGFREKGAEGAGWVNAGIYALPRSFLEAIPARPASLEHEILPAWIAREPGRAYRTPAYFCDIGTPERWRKACAELPREAARGGA
jgi:D-glycero-alpha-D-manno-heptose 1-phosphate guanylyltransferase